jgi:hypothetical protein
MTPASTATAAREKELPVKNVIRFVDGHGVSASAHNAPMSMVA